MFFVLVVLYAFEMPRAKVQWNKKFRGNQHLNRPNESEARIRPISPSRPTPDLQHRPSLSNETPLSASSKKISQNLEQYDGCIGKSSNIVINLDILATVISNFVVKIVAEKYNSPRYLKKRRAWQVC